MPDRYFFRVFFPCLLLGLLFLLVSKDSLAAGREHRADSRLVCLGDSVTLGVRGGFPGVREQDTFCYILGQKFKSYANKGIGGDKTAGMVRRFRDDVLKEKPTHLLLMVGINDVYDGVSSVPVEVFEKNVRGMVRRAQEHDILVTIMTPSIVQDMEWLRRFPPYLEAIRRISAEMDADMIDVYARFSEQYISNANLIRDWYGTLQNNSGWDYQHPHRQGHAAIAAMCAYYHRVSVCNP